MLINCCIILLHYHYNRVVNGDDKTGFFCGEAGWGKTTIKKKQKTIKKERITISLDSSEPFTAKRAIDLLHSERAWNYERISLTKPDRLFQTPWTVCEEYHPQVEDTGVMYKNFRIRVGHALLASLRKQKWPANGKWHSMFGARKNSFHASIIIYPRLSKEGFWTGMKPPTFHDLIRLDWEDTTELGVYARLIYPLVVIGHPHVYVGSTRFCAGRLQKLFCMECGSKIFEDIYFLRRLRVYFRKLYILHHHWWIYI